MNINEKFVDCPVFADDLPFVISLGGISYCDENYIIDRKKSAIAVIEYIYSGHGTVKTGNKTCHPQKGDTYLLAPGENHLYYSSKDDPWVKIWINVSGTLVNSLIDAYSLRNHTLFNCNSEPYIKRIHNIMSDRSLTPTEISRKSSIVFHELMQLLADNKPVSRMSSQEPEILKNYIDTNIYRHISIDELAQIVYKSPAQTIRIFKKAYGLTPYDYYMNNRIKKAVSLLEDTALSVKEIAFTLGFCDEHYFSNIFKQKTGKKPTDFR